MRPERTVVLARRTVLRRPPSPWACRANAAPLGGGVDASRSLGRYPFPREPVSWSRAVPPMHAVRVVNVSGRRRPSPGRGGRRGWPSGAVSMNDVTRILSAIEQGDPQAAEQLLPLVYDELRKLAAQRLAQEKPGPDAPGHGPGPRGVPPAGRRGRRPSSWDSRGHFFAAAAEAMRRILVENARRKRSAQARRRPRAGRPGRRGARDRGRRRSDLLALDEALDELAAKDPRKAASSSSSASSRA